MTVDPRSAGADDLLQALTVGDVAADDPAVIARFAQDAGLRSRWHAIAGTLEDLRTLRADLADPGPGAVSAFDAAAAIRAFRSDTSRRRWWWVVGVAAAALLAIGAIVWLNRGASGPMSDPMLGTGGGRLVLTPAGTWPEGAPLQWTGVRGAAGYRVEVEALDGRLTVLPHGPTGGLFPGTSWLPTAAQREDMPKKFRWRVVAVEASNETIDTSGWATVER